MAKQPWKPWHEVVKLRADLQSGKLPIYKDPIIFFAPTYPTHNLRHLARNVVLRLSGKNDKAVRQLELTYGCGKTHTLITLRHLVNESAKLPDVPVVQKFEQTIELTPQKPASPPCALTRWMWKPAVPCVRRMGKSSG